MQCSGDAGDNATQFELTAATVAIGVASPPPAGDSNGSSRPRQRESPTCCGTIRPVNSEPRPPSFATHKGVLLGFVFGAALGALFGRISIGIALCVALGYLYDSGYFSTKKSAAPPASDPGAHGPDERDGGHR